MDMKIALVGIGALLLVVLLLGGAWTIASYNGIIGQGQEVDAQWGQIQTVYQERADLIPNVVAVMQVEMKYESGLLSNLTALRTQWMNAKTPDDKMAAANGMDSAFARLLVVQENYPQLRATETANKLIDTLAGQENRIRVERMRYNDKVKNYNNAVKMFPGSIMAGMMGVKEKPYFQADAGAEKAPKVADLVK
jgi:LemA protein